MRLLTPQTHCSGNVMDHPCCSMAVCERRCGCELSVVYELTIAAPAEHETSYLL